MSEFKAKCEKMKTGGTVSALPVKKSGGKKKSSSKTQVNIVIAQPREPGKRAGSMTPSSPSIPPVPTPAPAQNPMEQAAGGFNPLGMANGPMKRGGAVKRADGGRVTKFSGGAESGVGRIEKAKHAKNKAK